MLTVVIIASLILTILVNVASSCYVCYCIAVDEQEPIPTMITIGGLVLINALVPYLFGCITGLWYMG